MGIPAFQYLSICSGSGGFDLGIRLALGNSRCCCYVENEAFAIEVLVKRMEEGFLDPAPIWSDLRTFDGKPWYQKIHGIIGGYPCEPWSLAGKRLGKDDPRHLWPSISRIIREIRPAYCFFENVEGHLSLGFPEVRAELREMGFRVEAGLFSAAEVGGSHIRKRLFIFAASEEVLALPSRLRGTENERVQSYRVLPDLGQDCICDENKKVYAFPPKPYEIEEWEKVLLQKSGLEPAFYNLADESANKLDKSESASRISQLRLLGNSIVPTSAAFALVVLLSKMAEE